MLSIHRLRLLHEFELRGTIAAVAEALNYTPPAVSQQLAQLERDVRVTLFEPVGRRVVLTPQGEILARHAERVLREVAIAEAELARSLDTIVGTLRVAAFQTATLRLIPPLLDRIQQEHPGLRILVSEIDPDGALSKLMAHEYDIVIGEEYPGILHKHSNNVVRTDLARDRIHTVCPEQIAHRIGSIADLADQPWVMEPVGNSARIWSTNVCRQAGFEPDVQFESGDLLVHRELVERGHACAFLPSLLWHGTEPPIGIAQVEEHYRAVFTAVRRGSEGRPDLTVFHDLLVDVYRDTGSPQVARDAPPDLA